MSDRRIPSFNIVALGPPASGKTVYIATLHQVIGGAALARGISFTTSQPERSRLQRIYDQVANPHKTWPSTTSVGDPMRETLFRCMVEWTGTGLSRKRLRRYAFPVFDISYVDYAGEWIPEAERQDPQLIDAFYRKVQDAHVILGVIDGLRLLQYLSGDDCARDFLHDEIRPIVEIMRGHPVPSHFVITKWDLLNGYTPGEIEDRLLASPGTGFRELVEARTAESRQGNAAGRVRMIPVSSVGDFAALGPDWEIKKVIDRKPTHMNVEVPLVAAVVDICDMAQTVLREEERAARLEKSQARRSSRTDTGNSGANVTVGPGGLTVNLGAVMAIAISSGLEVGRQLGPSAARVGRSMRRQYRRIRAHGLQAVRSDEAALFYVARAFRARLAEFESEPVVHPDGALALATAGQKV
jgi:hypothetical protein